MTFGAAPEDGATTRLAVSQIAREDGRERLGHVLCLEQALARDHGVILDVAYNHTRKPASPG
jgi:hypothetical protein